MKGAPDDEHSCILIEEGRFYGMGYISHYYDADNIQA
jgi:DNA polymerase-3 subunit epsilon